MNILNVINPAAVYIVSLLVGMIAVLGVIVEYRQCVSAVKSAKKQYESDNDLYERSN